MTTELKGRHTRGKAQAAAQATSLTCMSLFVGDKSSPQS